MKIGIITDILDNRKTGIEYYTELLVKHLKKVDKKNEYILIHSDKTKNLPLYKNFKEFKYKFPKTSRLLGIKTNFLFLPKELNVDLIHSPTHTPPFLFKPNTKTIITVHDITPILFPSYHKLRSLIFHKLFFPRILKNSDAIIAVSNSTKKDLIKMLKTPSKKIQVVYEGIHEHFKVLNKKECIKKLKKYGIKEEFILFVGTLEPRKNVTNLVKAFIEIKNKGMKEKLVIAGGKGWKYSKIFELIKENNLEKEIIFTGYAKEEELVALYNSAKIFVYPSIYEGFGFPILEAMACGCPVITSKTSSLPEVAGNAAILINNPKNTRELAEKINKLLKNEKRRKELIEKGLKQARKFSWDKCAKQTIKVYEKVYNS